MVFWSGIEEGPYYVENGDGRMIEKEGSKRFGDVLPATQHRSS